MGQTQIAEEWLVKNQNKMISCPYQPGNLTISKSSCARRYKKSLEEQYLDLMKGDLFNYTSKRGLSLCRECPIGKRLAIARPAPDGHPRPSRRVTFANHGWKGQSPVLSSTGRGIFGKTSPGRIIPGLRSKTA
jgi:hypothetical protein